MGVLEAYGQYRDATLRRLDAQSAAAVRSDRRRDALFTLLSVVVGMVLFGGGMLLGRQMSAQATCPQAAPRI